MWANVQLNSRPRGAVPTAAISSSDSLTQKTYPRIKQRVDSYHSTEVRQISFGSQTVVAMATSLSSRVSAISAFCRLTTQTPS